MIDFDLIFLSNPLVNKPVITTVTPVLTGLVKVSLLVYN